MAEKLSELKNNSREAVLYMTAGIDKICREMKKRSAGSEGEREAGAYLAEILRKDCGCGDIVVEPFKVHPAAFYSYFFFSAFFDCLCAAFFFIKPWIGIVFGLLAYLIFALQFVFYKKLLDPMFPEKESVNVTAVRPCSGELKQRIFLNGHIDAAREFMLNYRFGGIVFETPGVLAVAGVLYYIVLSVCRLCGAGDWTVIAGFWGLVFVPFFILVAFTFDHKQIVDGANDDLTGCYMAIAVLREMERLGVRLENTEIGVILTGSEEIGLRGAKAWCTAHKDDYNDVTTFVVSYDTIHDPRHLMVNLQDMNGTVKSDCELGGLFLQAADEAGVYCRKGKVPLMGGATDSAAFTQGGFRSVGITGLSHKLEDYYHTRRDSWDNLNEEGLENCYKATIALLEKIDGKIWNHY